MAATFSCNARSEGRPLPHFWEHCVGSCHASLALRADWQAQLARCRTELGFRHVRFHGLLSDDVGTLVVSDGKKIYSFFNADRIVDFLLSIGMKPLVELSFMPTGIASGDQVVMHYQGNVTPPLDMADWVELIDKLVRHWVERYGLAEVRSWPFEVWNEPNIPAFWSGTRDEYFALFESTFRTIKAIDRRIPVGGPATADCEWIDEFLAFCAKRRLRFDFVSTHLYPTDALGTVAQDTTTQLVESPRDVMRSRAHTVRRKLPAATPLYFTEWSSSSNARDSLHDEPYAAAFLARTILRNADIVDGYSWWTFSDLFEETYFPSQPFHGGFGLLTLHGIAKPAYRAFELLHGLGDTLLPVRGQHATVDVFATSEPGGALVLLATNHERPKHAIRSERVEIVVHRCPKPQGVLVRRVDAHHANAKAAWQAIGCPEYLDGRQVALLDAASVCGAEPLVGAVHDGRSLHLALDLPAHGIASVRIELGGTPH